MKWRLYGRLAGWTLLGVLAAVGVAALLTGKVRARGRTIVLLSGGNIMPRTLAQYLYETEPPVS